MTLPSLPEFLSWITNPEIKNLGEEIIQAQTIQDAEKKDETLFLISRRIRDVINSWNQQEGNLLLEILFHDNLPA